MYMNMHVLHYHPKVWYCQKVKLKLSDCCNSLNGIETEYHEQLFSVRVLCELCESSADRINLYCIYFIAPYIAMYETLECINKNCVNLLRGPF